MAMLTLPCLNAAATGEAVAMTDLPAREAPHPDPISELIEGLGMQAWVPGPLQLSRPWGLQIGPELGWCYLVQAGRCRLRVSEGSATVEMGPGDLAIVQPGEPHALSDGVDGSKDALEGLMCSGHFEHREPIVYGGGGERTSILPICFLFADGACGSWSGLLPRVMTVRGNGRRPATYADYLFQLVTQEADGGQPCAATIINRLVKILLVRTVYAHAGRLPAEQASWIRSLVDPSIGPALALMHEHPEVAWTVAALADAVAMSRTAFAVKFAGLLGLSPLEYLTELRMQRAAALLARTAAGLKEIGARVGYDSASSFSRAFTRWAGMPPRAYRESRRAGRAYPSLPPIVA